MRYLSDRFCVKSEFFNQDLSCNKNNCVYKGENIYTEQPDDVNFQIESNIINTIEYIDPYSFIGNPEDFR